MNKARWIRWLTVLGFMALYILGLSIRGSIMNLQQRELMGAEVPFTLESALQYRMTRMVHDGGGIPKQDEFGVEYPDGVNMRETYSIGAEYAYSALARLFPKDRSISNRFRWASVFIFCLGIPAIGAYAWAVYRSRAAGLIAALFYAISIASVTRSSGIELSRENFALPFFIAFLALDMLAERRRTGRVFWSASAGSAVCIAVAMMTWDLIQYGLGLWVLVQYVRLAWLPLRDPVGNAPAELATLRAKLGLQAVALLLVGFLNPYLAAHRFLLSPVMALFFVMVALVWIVGARRPGRWLLRLAPLVGLGVMGYVGARYSESYGHFGELLAAKIMHMNVKPEDPKLLSYNQRIMWTPALHSSNWLLTKNHFPSTLILSLVGMMSFIVPRTRDKDFKLLHPVIYCLFCLGTFILFFRFHVFAIIYMAVIIGGWAAMGFKSPGWRFYAITIAVMVGFGMEMFTSALDPKIRMTAKQYAYQNELVDWLEENANGRPVLANFGISGPILTYAGCPVVLHPKFETSGIRERVREYGEALFTKTEKELKAFADKYEAEYLVFTPGEFYPKHINMQMRYMVDAVEPSPESAAYKLSLKWQEEYFFKRERKKRELPRDFLRYFQYKWHNDKWVVFRIVTDDDQEMATRRTQIARTELQHGDLDAARASAIKAIQYDFLNEDAFWVLEKVQSLKRKGFQAAVPQ